MPKPIKGSFRFSPEALEERPELLKHIGLITTMWTHVESTLGRLLSIILDTDPVAGTAMYLTLTNQPQRYKAIKAAADIKLPTDDLKKKFDKLINSIKDPGEKRNDVVHGFWALSSENSDCLAMLDQKKMSLAVAYYDYITNKNTSTSSEDKKRLEETRESFYSSALEYTESDFIDIEREILHLLKDLKSFHNELFQYYKDHDKSCDKNVPK